MDIPILYLHVGTKPWMLNEQQKIFSDLLLIGRRTKLMCARAGDAVLQPDCGHVPGVPGPG